MKLAISKIILDQKAQPRTEINSQVIQEYADIWLDGAGFPPVTVFSDGESYWLADGWHRVNAAKVARRSEIDADVKPGTLRDAILYSAGANSTHGMRRTNEDKRRAVKALLEDTEWQKWSDNKIAKTCFVTHPFVGDLRKSLVTVTSDTERQYIDRWGNTAIMDTGNIGGISIREPEPMTIEKYEPTPVSTPTKSQFNRTNDNIDWAWWSWNPVTGCEHDCIYCYALDIANRFYPQGFKPTFHPGRLDAPKNTNPIVGNQGGRSVFVCSMADLFGAWVPNDWIWEVMKSVKENPQWTFIFLTKNPRRLASVQFPDNAWVGCTVDRQARAKPAEEAMKNVLARVKFVSCEPMLEPIKFENPAVFDWIIIGAQTKTTQAPEFQPKREWVFDLHDQAERNGVKVYCKPNLNILWREYPE